ncbi:flagellin [Arcobacter sp. FWKO B]|uniref:flagellin N-terminal helical domain-containing protein n=1 Tax=Arcobacter sp. FWKO B TaxID=2593672 RepID=UPI0018A33CBB|nr:flagellin [Arcobacter sp. FWKO B]QOG12181.1 flagellin [Arcobacter sp. FWKO B]QOG12182.1 flagellin [Arcobacter sp. FWKO B]
MRINTNVQSLNAQESATLTNNNIRNSLEKLSSGLRINKASDDASGLAIADKLRTQASSIGQSIANGNSAVSLTQIADKAMAEQSNILDIVKQKLIQAGTATTSSEGRKAIGKDIDKLLTQLNNIAVQTNYNGISLLQQSAGGTASAASQIFQMGEKSTNTITLTAGTRANTAGLQGMSALKISAANGGWSAGAARAHMASVDSAINQLNTWRSEVGSTQNQLESALRNMMTQQTNIKAAESVIRDVDYAAESANFNKQNIVAQAGTYAMSQANMIQQNVMRLLQ